MHRDALFELTQSRFLEETPDSPVSFCSIHLNGERGCNAAHNIMSRQGFLMVYLAVVQASQDAIIQPSLAKFAQHIIIHSQASHPHEVVSSIKSLIVHHPELGCIAHLLDIRELE